MNNETLSQEQAERKLELQYTICGTGITEIVLGSVTFIAGIVSVCLAADTPYDELSNVGAGIWCSVFAITAGAMNIAFMKNPIICLALSNMITSIVGASMTFILLILELACSTTTFPLFDSYVMNLEIIHIIMLLMTIAQLVLLIYNSIVFGRMYKINSLRFTTCYPPGNCCSPCCLPMQGAGANSPMVVYVPLNTTQASNVA
uniref:Uncharacterized protein n=1 Tax=Ciona savignyi TaxID=51511 RepID=H2ZFF9_CIOSA